MFESIHSFLSGGKKHPFTREDVIDDLEGYLSGLDHSATLEDVLTKKMHLMKSYEAGVNTRHNYSEAYRMLSEILNNAANDPDSRIIRETIDTGRGERKLFYVEDDY